MNRKAASGTLEEVSPDSAREKGRESPFRRATPIDPEQQFANLPPEMIREQFKFAIDLNSDKPVWLEERRWAVFW